MTISGLLPRCLKSWMPFCMPSSLRPAKTLAALLGFSTVLASSSLQAQLNFAASEIALGEWPDDIL
ncbi:MAG: hypothetical protein AAB211_05965, partial [Pseudomonadota bacterium]